MRALIDAAARLGSSVVGGPAYGAVGKTPAADPAARQRERDLAAAELRPLAAYAGERGVRLALEPLNRFETDLINSPTARALIVSIHPVSPESA